MHSQRHDVLFLQDTRWGFAYIHGGSQGRAGGLGGASAQDLLEGGIQRLYLDTSSIDLINIYQFSWTGADPQCIERRAELLSNCDGLLAGLPQRNVVILAGDFNTSLTRTPHCVGLQDFQGTHGRSIGTQHPDATTLVDLLQRRGLLAINTWDKQLGPTYQGGNGHQSRIDFVMVRHKSSD